MDYIDINNWKRVKHFKWFIEFEHPMINICSTIEITNLYNFCKENNFSINTALTYVAAKVCNRIEEFRYRIRGSKVVLHDIIDPCNTTITKDNLCSFVNGCKYNDNFKIFHEEMSKCIEYSKKQVIIANIPDVDNLLFITTLPWINITSVSHPTKCKGDNGIPRVVFGKFSKENGKIILPISVEVHHALADGYHVALYLKTFEEICKNLDLN